MSNPCLLDALATVPDPRARRGRSYPLPPILALLVLGILMGRRSPAAIVQLADDYGPEFALLLGFPRLQVPTPSLLSKLLPRLDVGAIEAVLGAWIRTRVAAATDPAQPVLVAIDGKCLRGSAQPGAGIPGVHLLAAFAPRVQAVLAQLRVDAKTNEHKAALELLGVLPPRPGGYLFTGDAMFTQTEVCQAIRDRDDHYVLVAKDNQPGLVIDIDAGLAFAATSATFSPHRADPARTSGSRAVVRPEHGQGTRSDRAPDPGEHPHLDRAREMARPQARVPGAPLGHPPGEAV